MSKPVTVRRSRVPPQRRTCAASFCTRRNEIDGCPSSGKWQRAAVVPGRAPAPSRAPRRRRIAVEMPAAARSACAIAIPRPRRPARRHRAVRCVVTRSVGAGVGEELAGNFRTRRAWSAASALDTRAPALSRRVGQPGQPSAGAARPSAMASGPSGSVSACAMLRHRLEGSCARRSRALSKPRICVTSSPRPAGGRRSMVTAWPSRWSQPAQAMPMMPEPMTVTLR